jgi:glycosyltransferase involved in cell wall biosynthesis
MSAARSDRKSVLMITYVFPPSAWVGGHRTTKYCKFIGAHGWLPTVLTARPSAASFRDEKLLKQIPADVDVHRTLDFDPARIENWLARNKKPPAASARAPAVPDGTAAPGLETPRLSLWQRVKRALKAIAKDSPDSHLFWVPFAVLRGLWILLTRRIDVIYCSTPPHSSHLVAYVLAKLARKPYVLDFRDPWSVAGSVSPPEGKLPWLLRIETATKRRIVRSASLIVCVSAGERDELRAEFPDVEPERFTFITNGFDSEDVPQGALPAPAPAEPLALIHAGTIYPGIADELFEALRRIVARAAGQPPGIVVHLLGEIAFDYQGIVEELRASGIVQVHGMQPHARCLQMMRESDVLMILMGGDVYQPSHLPSKGFEYLRIGQPILAVAREGELAELARRSGLGTVTPPHDVDALIDAGDAMREAKRAGTLRRAADAQFIARYERKALAGQLARELDGVHARGRVVRPSTDLRALRLRRTQSG